jgi:hypothetical protein
MSATPSPQSSRPETPQDFHWGIAYLREDMQDQRNELRSEIRGLGARIDGIGARIDGIDARINETAQNLRDEIRGSNNRTDGVLTCIGENNRFMLQRIDQRHEELAKSLDARFLWMTTMIGLTGVILAVIKI